MYFTWWQKNHERETWKFLRQSRIVILFTKASHIDQTVSQGIKKKITQLRLSLHSMDSQPSHYWPLGPHSSFLGGAVLWIIRCSSSILGLYNLHVWSTSTIVTRKNVSRLHQMSPRGQNWPLVENHYSVGRDEETGTVIKATTGRVIILLTIARLFLYCFSRD